MEAIVEIHKGIVQTVYVFPNEEEAQAFLDKEGLREARAAFGLNPGTGAGTPKNQAEFQKMLKEAEEAGETIYQYLIDVGGEPGNMAELVWPELKVCGSPP